MTRSFDQAQQAAFNAAQIAGNHAYTVVLNTTGDPMQAAATYHRTFNALTRTCHCDECLTMYAAQDARIDYSRDAFQRTVIDVRMRETPDSQCPLRGTIDTAAKANQGVDQAFIDKCNDTDQRSMNADKGADHE